MSKGKINVQSQKQENFQIQERRGVAGWLLKNFVTGLADGDVLCTILSRKNSLSIKLNTGPVRRALLTRASLSPGHTEHL